MSDPAAILAAFRAEPAYLGYRLGDMGHPYARFLRSEDTARAAAIGERYRAPLEPGAIEPFEAIADALSRPGHLRHEDGWCAMPGGGAAVAVRTPMPGVRTALWDWWFGWHGSEAARYKLWAPAEHMVAMWRDGDGERPGPGGYIGRTSLIKEHIGSVYLEGAIRFVDPVTLGFPPPGEQAVAICGRAGEVGAPVEHTWLIHHVRATADGCEMRSRFYLGHDPRHTGTGAALPPPDPDAGHQGPVPAELLVHCATEMHHLAGFLPALHAAFA